MISTLGGKPGNVGVMLPVAERPGLFLSSHVVLAFSNNEGAVIFLEPSLERLEMSVG